MCNEIRKKRCPSSFLFKLYINDVISLLYTMDTGTTLGYLTINILSYAEYVVIFSKTKKKLRYLYKILNIKVIKLRLNIQVCKLKCIIKKKCLNCDKFEICQQYKYFEFYISFDLSNKNFLDIIYIWLFLEYYLYLDIFFEISHVY